MNKITLPTGYLFTDTYSRGELETLSIGDYGKDRNIKADFLGYVKEINGVSNGYCKPLTEKWVVTLSTQYECCMDCKFCDCPKIKFSGNATMDDLVKQYTNAIKCFPEITYTDRMNIHFARMGEPAFNTKNVFAFARWLLRNKKDFQKENGLRIETIHPVFTTSMPDNMDMWTILNEWCEIKNHLYNGQAGLQISINSTDDAQRQDMFNGLACSLDSISRIGRYLEYPVGRKYCLNFAYASNYEINAKKLRDLFDPEYFMVKITPIHNNNACRTNDIATVGGYEIYAPYREVEKALISVGFDVLVFVPSMDEEKGLVTCGNVVLSGSTIQTDPMKKPNITGI